MNKTSIDTCIQGILQKDPYLAPFETHIRRRMKQRLELEQRLTDGCRGLPDFAIGHLYYGLHHDPENGRWVFREWAPNATAVFLTGDMTGWAEKEPFRLKPVGDDGIWEGRFDEDTFRHGQHYKLKIYWPGGCGERIPSYTQRVVQDPESLIFAAQVWNPEHSYVWKNIDFQRKEDPPYIYEAHIGMAQEKEGIGTFTEFQTNILPRIAAAGYNVLQLMGIQEHPYYGSFGYHVSNFFAVSSRFGTPEAFKALIDAAHGLGIAVVMDIVHSHAVNNEVEGLSCFDGSRYQFFHDGPRGVHRAWDSRCFDYGKEKVLQFLLSNCRFWLEVFHLDGFRFDGITSMLYRDHGLEKAFTSYDDYFCGNVDEEALAYLGLANRLIHQLNPKAVTIAEDISGMPGLAVPVEQGGTGFDFRLAMGLPDFWIRLLKEYRDENWPMGHLWYELTNRRADEKTIGYAESHDQALVGDKTLSFRLMDADMYTGMQGKDSNLRIDRGIALHKLIRLVTFATAGDGYMNFMGNEFGHPEWIDFPREGNNWSYQYARRQWHLVDDPDLKYRFLAAFDRQMIAFGKQYRLQAADHPDLLHEHSDDKVLVFRRGHLVFAFNFHPTQSYPDYAVSAPPGGYQLLLDSDSPSFGGYGRVHAGQIYFTMPQQAQNHPHHQILLYLPARTALVLSRLGSP